MKSQKFKFSLQMKIFIFGVNTQLGFHLTETLRQDHLVLQGYPIISGTLFQSQAFVLHDSVEQTFNFSKQRDMTVKNAVDSDVLIIDIRYDPAPQIEFILKVLKHYNREKTLKVIGISNYMTWSNAQTTQFSQIPHDKQTLLQFSVNKNKWRQTKLKKQNYPLRVPHSTFVYNYLLEQQIMQLKHHQSLIQPIIICTGVLYGKSGMDLKQQIQSAISCKECPLIKLKRSNFMNQDALLPVLHIDRLLEKIELIVYHPENQQSNQSKQYTVLCEDQPKSIVSLVENLHQLCGHMEYANLNAQQNLNNISSDQSMFVPEFALAKNKRLYSVLFNIHFQRQNKENLTKEENINQSNHYAKDSLNVSQEKKESISANMVKQNLDNDSDKKWRSTLVHQFLNYYEIQFKHFILPEQIVQQLIQNQQKKENEKQLSSNQTKEMQSDNFNIKSLLNKYLVLDKKKLSQIFTILITNGEISHERLATPQEDKKKPKPITQNNQKRDSIKKQPYQSFFPEIIKYFLIQNINSNFLICLKKQLIIKMFGLINESQVECFKHLKFISITGKENNLLSQNSFIPNDNLEQSVEIFSEEFFSIFGISKIMTNPNSQQQPMQQAENSILNNKNIVEKLKQPTKDQQEGSEETKINLASQYLLDNLIVYMAEAKQQLKLKGKLKMGQKFEGKENIKLFIEELKKIKERQLRQESEKEEDKES